MTDLKSRHLMRTVKDFIEYDTELHHELYALHDKLNDLLINFKYNETVALEAFNTFVQHGMDKFVKDTGNFNDGKWSENTAKEVFTNTQVTSLVNFYFKEFIKP